MVAEEGAAFGEHDLIASCFGGFANRACHFTRRDELSLFDVKCFALGIACLGGCDDEVGLSAEERGDLDQIDDAGDCVGLFGCVDVGGGGDIEFLFDGSEVFEPLFDPDASL